MLLLSRNDKIGNRGIRICYTAILPFLIDLLLYQCYNSSTFDRGAYVRGGAFVRHCVGLHESFVPRSDIDRNGMTEALKKDRSGEGRLIYRLRRSLLCHTTLIKSSAYLSSFLPWLRLKPWLHVKIKLS